MADGQDQVPGSAVPEEDTGGRGISEDAGQGGNKTEHQDELVELAKHDARVLREAISIIGHAVEGISEVMGDDHYGRSLLIARATMANDLISDIIGVGQQYIRDNQRQPAIYAVENQIVDSKGNPIGG